jgi:uncharacterized membrane protein SpoIIM required for sporulation
MSKKIFFGFCATSICCWLLLFLTRIFIIEIPDILDTSELTVKNNVVDEITQLLHKNDTQKAFLLIFKNNLKGCLLNIAGGVFLGLGTLFNLMINGFYSADVFASSYKAGMSVETILKVTLPHSFELIGFWLSGAIGLYIAWNIIQFMRGKASFPPHFYKQIGIGTLMVVLIILSAAYVEAYISVKNA